MNELKKTFVICESIMLEEQSSACDFVLKSIFVMALNFSQDNLKIIYSNIFLKTS